jgi:hypothetical protein
MSARSQGARGFALFLLAGLAACSGAPQRESPPPAEVAGGASGAPQIERSHPDVQPGTEGGVAAATRSKISDDEYVAAIAVLEVSSGVKEASADLASGRRQVLGIPRPGGSGSRLPGVRVALESLPPDVKIAKIAGFIEGTSNRHAMRYGLLVEKFAAEYNETMVRGVTR